MTTKIMIVDDHPVFRAGLANLINRDERFDVVAEAAGVTEAMGLLKKTAVQLAIVDLSLSEGNGLQLIKRIHSHDPTIKILVASMHDDMVYAERVLRAGAHGYINKEQAASKVFTAIENVLRDGIYLDSEVASHIVQRRSGGHDRMLERPEEILSNRELEVFTLLGKGFSSKEIADQLCVSSKTVDSHRDHIKKKLGVSKGTILIQRAVAWTLKANQLGPPDNSSSD